MWALAPKMLGEKESWGPHILKVARVDTLLNYLFSHLTAHLPQILYRIVLLKDVNSPGNGYKMLLVALLRAIQSFAAHVISYPVFFAVHLNLIVGNNLSSQTWGYLKNYSQD